MSNRPIRLLLEDMLESVQRIERYRKGMSVDVFKKDEKTIDAVVRNLEIIGEAANRLPDDFKIGHPVVVWHKIIGLRHRIVHDYFGLDLDIVWNILEKDMPDFEKSLVSILRESFC